MPEKKNRSCEDDKPGFPSCNTSPNPSPKPQPHHVAKGKRRPQQIPCVKFSHPAPVFQCDARSPQGRMCRCFIRPESQPRPAILSVEAPFVPNRKAVKTKNKPSIDHPISHPILCMPTPPRTRSQRRESNLEPLYKKKKNSNVS